MKAFISRYLFGKAPLSATPRLLSLQVVFSEPFTPPADSLAASLQALHPSLDNVDFAHTRYSDDDEAASGEMIGRFKWTQAVPAVPLHRPGSEIWTGAGWAAALSGMTRGRPDGSPASHDVAIGSAEMVDDYSAGTGPGTSSVLLTHRVSMVVTRLSNGLPERLYRRCVGEPLPPVPPEEADAYRAALQSARGIAYLTYRTESADAVTGRTSVVPDGAALVAPLHRRYEALTMVAASLCQQPPRCAVGVLNTEARTGAPASVLSGQSLKAALDPDAAVDLLACPNIAPLYAGLHAVPSLGKHAKPIFAYRTTGGAELLGEPNFIGYAPSLGHAESIRRAAALLWAESLRLGTPSCAEQHVALPRLVEGGDSVSLCRPRLDEINATGGASQNVLVLRPSPEWRDITSM